MLKENNDFLEKVLFNEKSLMILNLRELREVGRKLGLPSSTTLNKKDLVNSILEVIYGKVELPAKKNVGRPSVHEFDLNKYIAKVQKHQTLEDELNNFGDAKNYGSLVISSPTQKYCYGEEIEIRIFVTEGEKCYLKKRAFIQAKDDIEISSDLAKKMNLKNFDVVEISVVDDKFKIVSVNGIVNKRKIDDVVVCGEQTKKGKIQDFYLSTKEEIKNEIEKVISSCQEEKINIVILSQKEYSADVVSSVQYDINDDPNENYKKIIYFASLCEKYIYESQDIVVIFEDINEIESVMEKLDEKVKLRLKTYLDNLTSDLLKLGNIVMKFNLANPVVY